MSFSSSGKLPIGYDVMKYLFFKKNCEGTKFKPLNKIICCPLKTGSVTASCLDEKGCVIEERQCVVAKLKYDGHWIDAGYKIISDVSITQKVLKLANKHRDLVKNRARNNETEVKKREAFTVII